MNRLPLPTETLAGCVWLPRIIAKARQLQAGTLPSDYVSRFGHPGGIDGQFLAFFELKLEDVLAASAGTDEQVVAWFASVPGNTPARLAEWNHTAVNLGRPGFPLAGRLPVALSTTYRHLVFAKPPETIFEVIEADEKEGV